MLGRITRVCISQSIVGWSVLAAASIGLAAGGCSSDNSPRPAYDAYPSSADGPVLFDDTIEARHRGLHSHDHDHDGYDHNDRAAGATNKAAPAAARSGGDGGDKGDHGGGDHGGGGSGSHSGGGGAGPSGGDHGSGSGGNNSGGGGHAGK